MAPQTLATQSAIYASIFGPKPTFKSVMKVLKRKAAEEVELDAKKAKLEEREEGEIVSDDEDNKENVPKKEKKTALPKDHRGLIKKMLTNRPGHTILEIQMPESAKLRRPDDEEERIRKMRALFNGKRSVEKKMAREYFKKAPSGPLLKKK